MERVGSSELVCHLLSLSEACLFPPPVGMPGVLERLNFTLQRPKLTFTVTVLW